MYSGVARAAPLPAVPASCTTSKELAAIEPVSGATTVATPVAPGARYWRVRPLIGSVEPEMFWSSTKSWSSVEPATPPSV